MNSNIRGNCALTPLFKHFILVIQQLTWVLNMDVLMQREKDVQELSDPALFSILSFLIKL